VSARPQWLRHRSLAACAIALAVIGSQGCRGGDDARASSRIVFGIENDLTNLDPIKSQEPYSLRVVGQIFEGLVTLNARHELEPVLAESWSHNATFDTWTFQIRKGVRFQEDDIFGQARTREVTAQDVVDSFQRIVSKESYPAFVLSDALQGVQDFQEGRTPTVSGLRAVGPMTVEMKLQRPEPSFLYRITSPWFVVFPREAVALGPDVFGRTKAVGTGPFRLVSRTDNEVVLARNPSYWRERSGVDTVVFRVIKNDQVRASELRNGTLSMMVLPPSLIPGVLAGNPVGGEYPLRQGFRNAFVVRGYPTFNSHFIGFNCDKLDVHLRRAISLAINRAEVLQAIAQGAGQLTTGTVPVGLLGYRPPYTGDIFDTARARTELAQSGFKVGRDTLELLVHEKDNTEQLGQLVQAQLKRIGIDVRIRKLDYNTVVGRMISGDTELFALALEYVFSAPEPILNNIFNSEKIPVPNFWHYRNPAVDQKFTELRGIGDRDSANALAQAIEKTVIDDAPAAFLYQKNNLVIYDRRISGVAFNGHSIPLLWEARLASP
jgi:ABC-type transport system substrate-binding protein